MEKSWYDAVGDRWEKEGTDFRRIFEFNIRIGEAFEAGGMLETALSCEPGDEPSILGHIKRVIVRGQRTLEEVVLEPDSVHIRRSFNSLRRSLS